jgi:hypothetical protein
VIFVSDISLSDLKDLDLLVVGSPINGWRPSEKMGKFLESIPSGALHGCGVTSFDTRIKVFFHGDAAKKISRKLVASGGELISEPQFFYVRGKEGPLVEGEIERATAWGEDLKHKSTHS